MANDNKDSVTLPRDRRNPIEKYSMIEISNESAEKSGWTRSVTSIIQRFPLFFLIWVVIIIVIVRGRFCRGKRKRYTL